MVQLMVDEYRLIIETIVSGDFEDIDTLDTLTDQQQCLARMCRASKMLYSLCIPELYKDCLVADFNTFIQDLKTNPRKIEHLCQVETLGLYHSFEDAYKEPAYSTLLRGGHWRMCGIKRMTCDPDAAVQYAIHQKYLAFAKHIWLIDAAATVRETMASHPKLLSKLATVIMTDFGNQVNGTSKEDFAWNEQIDNPPIPLLLLGLPTVRDYCQQVPAGHLSLPNLVIMARYPSIVVTYHPISMLSDVEPRWSPPIVFGSINRYMCYSGRHVFSGTDTGEDLEWEDLVTAFRPLTRFLVARDFGVMAEWDEGKWTHSQQRSTNHDDTTIELYSYITHSNMITDMADSTGPRPPSDLRHIQTLLDQGLGEDWKGKVTLKNKEDCPPCTACRFEGLCAENNPEL